MDKVRLVCAEFTSVRFFGRRSTMRQRVKVLHGIEKKKKRLPATQGSVDVSFVRGTARLGRTGLKSALTSTANTGL